MWNPIKELKRVRSYLKIKKAADKLLNGIEEEQKLLKLSKSIFKSKTFWVNLLALLNELIKILPLNESLQGVMIPTDVMAVGLPLANVALRKFTKIPVTLMPVSYTENEKFKEYK